MEIGDNHLITGDGASHTRVKFRVLVFRPFIEEIIVGKIKRVEREKETRRDQRPRDQETRDKETKRSKGQ